MSRANMDKNPDEVAAMFDGVAKRYDLVNDLLSLGQTKAWRRATTAIIAPKPGMKILDLAAGTGSSSEPLAAAGADVIPADFSEGMLAAGRKARPPPALYLCRCLESAFCRWRIRRRDHLLRSAQYLRCR